MFGDHFYMDTARVRNNFIAFATFVFLIKYFVSRGPTASASHLVNLAYFEIGVISTLFLLELVILRRVLDRKTVIAFTGFLSFYLICLLHLAVSVDNSHMTYFVKATRLSGYVFVVLIFSIAYFDWPTVRKYFIVFSYMSIFWAIITKLFFPEYFSDLGYSFSRPRAFLSEPSTFAPILAFALYHSLRIKSFLLVLASSLCIYFVASGTVYFVVVLVGIALVLRFFIGERRNHLLAKVLVASLLLSVVSLGMIFSPLIDQGLSKSFNYYRAKMAIQSLTNSGVGSSRLVSLFNYFDVLQHDGDLFLGKGLNSATTYFGEDSKTNDNREYSILHSFLFSFGIFGTTFLLLLLGLILLILMRAKSPDVYLFYCCFLFTSLINSSGGHTLYKFIYIFFFLIMLRPDQLGVSFRFESNRLHFFKDDAHLIAR